LEARLMDRTRAMPRSDSQTGRQIPGLANISADRGFHQVRQSRLNLASLPWLRPLLASRWPIFVARCLTLAGFTFTILAGLFGSPVGSHNFAIIFVWIAWWTALKLAFIPLGGRSWCSVCPVPMPGEWLQRRSLVSRSTGRSGLGLRWPKKLRGYWLQASLFMVIGLFSAVTLTNGRLTAWIFLGLVALAASLSLVFEGRSFCSYVCPIGGFTGIYAQSAPVEVRVTDPAACAAHEEKTCYIECPWGLYPLALRDSSACGLCMECLRVCPKDNIALNLRPFGSDLGTSRSANRLDAAFMALVMLGSALAFSAVFTGPWGSLKTAAYQIGSKLWLAYAGSYLVFNLLLLPGLFVLAVISGKKLAHSQVAWRKTIADQAQALLPLGLFTWIAFTISFAFPKFQYVLSVLSDPFGWGWNLLGTAGASWSVGDREVVAALQVAALLTGLLWSAGVSMRLAGQNQAFRDNRRQSLPVILFCLAYTLLMLWLLVG